MTSATSINATRVDFLVANSLGSASTESTRRRITRARGRYNDTANHTTTPMAKNNRQRGAAKSPKNDTRSRNEPCTPVVGGAELEPGVPVMTATTAAMMSIINSRFRLAGENSVTRSSPTSHPRCRSGG